MNSATVAANCSNEDANAGRGAQLLTAASEGRGWEVLWILIKDLHLLQVGDPIGDTIMHLVVRFGHVKTLQQLIWFLQDHHDKKLLSAAAMQGNGHGDTPLHLAVKMRNKEAMLILCKAEPKAVCVINEDGKFPDQLAKNLDITDDLLAFAKVDRVSARESINTFIELIHFVFEALKNFLYGNWFEGDKKSDNENKLASEYKRLLSDMHWSNVTKPQLYKLAMADVEMDRVGRTDASLDYKSIDTILEMLKIDLNLIQHKNQIGNTVFHEAVSNGNIDMLANLVGQFDDHLPTLKILLLEGNEDGNTALHLALLTRKMKAVHYLVEAEPEAAYKINNEGICPLYLALEKKQYDLMKYVLEVMPEASISLTIRHNLLTAAKKGSLPHAVIRARNLTMLEVILKSVPSLIDSLDEKGWKPLSYAAYKGYLEEVKYLINKFPKSVTNFDCDGTLPIHKAVSGGHTSIFREFISNHPQTLYDQDKKGRSILHIAVRYDRTDIITYLIQHTPRVQKILHLKDHEGKTYNDYLAEKQRHLEF